MDQLIDEKKYMFAKSKEVKEFQVLSDKLYEGHELTSEQDKRFVELFDYISEKNEEMQAFGVCLLLVFCARDYELAKTRLSK
jgi:hypothetical protein